MTRLLTLAFLVLAVVAMLALALTAVLRALRETEETGRRLGRSLGGLEIRTIAYVALLAVMIGVALGWLGGP